MPQPTYMADAVHLEEVTKLEKPTNWLSIYWVIESVSSTGFDLYLSGVLPDHLQEGYG